MRAALVLVALSTAAPAAAQTGRADDVGLTMDGGVLTVIYGQVCGPFSCQPLPGGTIGRGQPRTLVHYAAPVTPFAIAAGLPGPCTPLGGFANALLLGPPVITLAVGVTSTPPILTTPCDQGLGVTTVRVPSTAPAGLVLRFQSVGVSKSGVLALGPAIETRIG